VHLPEEKQAILRKNGVSAQDVTLGIRPEHIIICDDDTTSHVSAVVDVSEMMGSSINLHVKVNQKDVIIIVQTMKLTGELKDGFAFGEKVNFTFGGDMIHMFNKETEMNLLV